MADDDERGEPSEGEDTDPPTDGTDADEAGNGVDHDAASDAGDEDATSGGADHDTDSGGTGEEGGGDRADPESTGGDGDGDGDRDEGDGDGDRDEGDGDGDRDEGDVDGDGDRDEGDVDGDGDQAVTRPEDDGDPGSADGDESTGVRPEETDSVEEAGERDSSDGDVGAEGSDAADVEPDTGDDGESLDVEDGDDGGEGGDADADSADDDGGEADETADVDDSAAADGRANGADATVAPDGESTDDAEMASGNSADEDGSDVAEAEAAEAAAEDAEDGTGPTYDPDDLVAGGEYVGNDGTDADETAAGTLVEPAEPAPAEPPESDEEGEVDEEGEEGEDGLPEPTDDGPGGVEEGLYEAPDSMADATPIERRTGPAEDQEMPLADHVEEMVARLFVVIAVAGVVSVAVFPFGEELIDLLWYQVLPGGDVARPRLYHPLALVITQLKVASLGGLIVALPVFVYQTYAFMRPGLYPHERRYYLAAVPTSLVLAFVGVTFAYFIVLPVIFTYFLYYTDTVASIAFALSQTFNLILLLMGYLAIVFQIPLFIMLAIMMGLTTRRWLQTRRLYFWAGFAGLAFLFSPDPTGMAPFIVALTMVVLFEGTLLLLRWTGN